MSNQGADTIQLPLKNKLVSKGLQANEIGLFIRDVVRAVEISADGSLKPIRERLQLLGWPAEYADFGTIQMIQAYYSSETIHFR